jgi:hypothetical protein
MSNPKSCEQVVTKWWADNAPPFHKRDYLLERCIAEILAGIRSLDVPHNGKPSVGAQIEGVATVNSAAREPAPTPAPATPWEVHGCGPIDSQWVLAASPAPARTVGVDEIMKILKDELYGGPSILGTYKVFGRQKAADAILALIENGKVGT